MKSKKKGTSTNISQDFFNRAMKSAYFMTGYRSKTKIFTNRVRSVGGGG